MNTKNKAIKKLKWKYDSEKNYFAESTLFAGQFAIWKEGRQFVLKFKEAYYSFKKLSSAKKVAQLIHEG